MSVINKVLRDLDSRAPQPLSPEGLPRDGASLTRGTSSVDVLPPAVRSRAPGGAAWALVALLALGAALSWWLGRGTATLPASAPMAAAVAPASPASAQPRAGLAPQPGAPSPVPSPVGPAPVVAAPVPMARAAVARAPASAPLAAGLPLPPDAPSPAPIAAPAAMGARQAPPTPGADAARPGPRVDTQAGAPQAAATGWPEAALEALAQAQRTWNSGARDAAIDFLTDALAGVERAHAQEWAAGGAAAQAPLAMLRELARMGTVQGHHASVLDLLRRHERLMAQQADLWAMRGSAAQRMSQHADAAQSYQMALKLRPGEPRWMLGTAVSLAAQGQTGPAAEWVEQARGLGPVSTEVLAYLRQLGVAVRDR